MDKGSERWVNKKSNQIQIESNKYTTNRTGIMRLIPIKLMYIYTYLGVCVYR